MSESTHTLDATVGGASSTSYLTAADVALVLAIEPAKAAVYTAEDASTQDARVMTASLILDHYLDFAGAPASETQALRWPRTGCYNRDGVEISDSALPHELIHAVADLAYELCGSDLLVDNSPLDGFNSISVGSIKLDVAATKRKGLIPGYIISRLAPLLRKSSSFNAAVLRA